MVLNTLSVGAAVTPTVTKTWVSHYLNRAPLKAKPTAHISYDLGLHLVRRFVEYSAFHTVEELQAFTGQWVPAPRWVKTEEVAIDEANVEKAAELIVSELGKDGVAQVGGKEWWRWRREDSPLKAEWIEMRKDYYERKERGEKGDRVMLYVHGGAYYFGSVNEHRYQIQRHARKLKARCLAPRYRLAPQFPFPCGLQDCLAAYLYLLGRHAPSEIIVAGDSAGGGMVLSLLVVLRDQGIPLPAGGVLLSPWVDLTHSFPSVCDDASLDYIPGDGFMHKPSMCWPPPTIDDVKDEAQAPAEDGKSDAVSEKPPPPPTPGSVMSTDEAPVSAKDRKRGYSVLDPADVPKTESLAVNGKTKTAPNGQAQVNGTIDASTHLPAVMVDGKLIQIRDQIQMYAANNLLYHPLVSPVLQPSLGGLPPILIQVGGGELLRDEQLYLAHKMANPLKYQPRKAILDHYDPDRTIVNKYKPTNVQVQLWEDMCHVGHTLSFTRPAKFMYRSVAQFGAWALAHAQQRPIDIPIDEESDTDSVSSVDADDAKSKKSKKTKNDKNGAGDEANVVTIPEIKTPPPASVGKAGDPLPPFTNHMIRQRVDRHGDIYPLAPASDIPALNLSPEEIGVLKEGPVKKWLVRQEKWNKKFASTKRELQRKRARQLAKGYVGLAEGERPPPTALAGMRTRDLPRLEKVKTSWGMMMWSGWGSKHDQIRASPSSSFVVLVYDRAQGSRHVLTRTREQVKQNQDADHDHTDTSSDTPTPRNGDAAATTMRETAREPSRADTFLKPRLTSRSRSGTRSRSHSRSVTDEGQASSSTIAGPSTSNTHSQETNLNPAALPPGATIIGNTIIPASDTTSTRPTAGGIAYPFKLKVADAEDVRSSGASVVTLESGVRPVSPMVEVTNPSGAVESSEVNGSVTPAVETPGETAVNGVVGNGKAPERPAAPERFETAREML